MRKRSAAPDRVVEHAVERCPDCGYALFGGTSVRHREVIGIDLPPAGATDHRLRRWIGPRCTRRCIPTLDAADGVVGQHRSGPNLLALIATLHEESRTPVGVIQQHLATISGVRISVGAIADALRTVATRGTARADLWPGDPDPSRAFGWPDPASAWRTAMGSARIDVSPRRSCG